MKPCDPSAATAPEANAETRCNVCAALLPGAVEHRSIPGLSRGCIPVMRQMVIDSQGRFQARDYVVGDHYARPMTNG